MKNLYEKVWLLSLTMLMAPSVSFAKSWVCHNEALTRNVVIFYPNKPEKLPCKVYYTKPKENVMPRTLWRAVNDDTYCDRKAIEFIESLELKGWHCSRDND